MSDQRLKDGKPGAATRRPVDADEAARAVANDPGEAAHKGAVEMDRPGDTGSGNPNADGVDDEGMPDDPIATCEDAIGANIDESEG